MKTATTTAASRSRRLLRRASILGAGLAVTAAAFAVTAPGAQALRLPPGGLVNAPAYCLAVYGDPSPCPPPDRPDPITDPTCLRVDVEPLHCPYLP